MKNILITGGAGFVGSNLAVKFRERGLNVVALDNLKRRGSELNLKRLKEHGVIFVHGDIRSPEDLEISNFRPDFIIECSAEPSVLAGYNTSARYCINTNLMGTVNCMEAARRWGASVVFLSTSRVYPIGALNALRFAESETRFELDPVQTTPGASSEGISHEFPLTGARSLYGATKLSSEHIIEEYQMMYGIKGVILRCGCIAGPWQMGRVDQGVFVHWMGSHYFKKELAYFGYGAAGKQVRDLIHIDDLYGLIENLVADIGKFDRMVFNVGGGRTGSLSLLETTEICSEITGNRIKVRGELKERDADVRIYITDLSHARKITRWSPEKGAAEILTDIFNWIRSNESEVKNLFLG